MDSGRLDTFLDGLIPSAAPCYAAAVVDKKGVIYERFSGYRQIEPETKAVGPETLFDLASLTKVVAVTPAFLRSMQQGVLSLSMTIGDWFDDPGNFGAVTIKQLATHCGGFVPERRLWNFIKDPSMAVSFILHDDPIAEPGAQVAYSCFGFIILGAILEKAWGKRLDCVVHDLVTDPLELHHTLFRPLDKGYLNIAATEPDSRDGVYHVGVVHDENANYLGGVSGNAGLFSTLGDLERYCSMLLDESNPFLSSLSRSLISTDQSEGIPGEHRSIGWKVLDPMLFGNNVSSSTFGHTGFTGTSIVVDPEKGRAAILLTNRVHPTRENKKLLPLRREFHQLVFQ